ncbi:MAG: PCRF domain-containing protein, partial [Myxococcales bacterium]|nr:PCRF domain-containing protein [Myxococcales bacterium]
MNAWSGCGGIFDVEGKTKKLASLEGQMAAADFWRDRQRAEGVCREARELKRVTHLWTTLSKEVDDLSELHLMAAEEGDDATLEELAVEGVAVSEKIEKLEFLSMLDDEDDSKDAILVIHSGAGGTEAADWAEMLMRLYTRWM